MRAPSLLALAALTMLSIAGCRSSSNPDLGRSCATGEAPCPTGLRCVEDADGTPVCMESCADTSDATCWDGALCLATVSGDRVCWIGGPVAIGGICESSEQCAHGGVCIRSATGDAAECMRACSPGREGDCAEGERCTPTVSGDQGFCN